MKPAVPVCGTRHRRAELFAARDRLNGLDYVEALDDGTSLCVHFFGDVPEELGVGNIRILGGRRIRNLEVVAVEAQSANSGEVDDCLHLRLDREGDFSTYLLCLVDEEEPEKPPVGFDPRYVCAEVRFRIDCPDGTDCVPVADCPPPAHEPIEIDYLAKDYASFRRLMLDRLAVTIPDWSERHEADLGVTLVELFAYAADHLSYHQDAVATEAYLGTARRRRSVRRHARLVDYRLGEGTNARAWVTVRTDTDIHKVDPKDLLFVTALADLPVDGHVLTEDEVLAHPASTYRAFEAVTAARTVSFHADHSEISIYTWGDEECRLPEGTTRATLLDDDGNGCRVLHLVCGDLLVFEEVKGAVTAHPADADPAHRHAVRLTRVYATTDPLLDVQVLEVEWDIADALPFCLTVSVRRPAPSCEFIQGISVARGNVILVDHGRTVGAPLGTVPAGATVGECACEGSLVDLVERPAPYEPTLPGSPLTWAEPVDRARPAVSVLRRDPGLAEPAVSLAIGTPVECWTPLPDLLSSDGEARNFVVEVDDEGAAHLRFGDGELGARPPARASVHATYRVGNGTAGNVGRDAIVALAVRGQRWSGVRLWPRNPIAATGGADPEPIAEAKMFAPYAFRAQLRRAVTAEDYARIAQRHGGLRAAGELVWTGSWYAARVGLDPDHTDEVDDALCTAVTEFLHPYRRVGHDLEVVAATKIPLDVEVTVCVRAHYSRGDVRRALLAVLGSGSLPDGRLGMFHPDSLTFGTDVRVSAIVAAAQAVEGVASVSVTRLRRWNEPDDGAVDSGVLRIGDMEVARISNDRNLAELGRLELVLGGGR
ncbi:putative baseplate assembly protein [Nocardia sp. XZ_19_231]|uniref:putative baseplate assembly protein n=1 Tax=Nocardia sp. XZ_19_231 TaxID=2769252 RepID=UPI00188DDDD9|nr:putative baseplate assembly protein [Nocardia sp. XZ_19_231]